MTDSCVYRWRDCLRLSRRKTHHGVVRQSCIQSGSNWPAPPARWLERLPGADPLARLDIPCQLGAAWRIDGPGTTEREIAWHMLLSGEDLFRRVGDVILGKSNLHDPPGFPVLRPRAGLPALDAIIQQRKRQGEVDPQRIANEVGELGPAPGNVWPE